MAKPVDGRSGMSTVGTTKILVFRHVGRGLLLGGRMEARAGVRRACAGVILALVLLAPAASAQSPEDVSFASFQYKLGHSASGELEGTCDSVGILWTGGLPGHWTVHGTPATLHLFETWVNTTETASPKVVVQSSVEQRERALPLSESTIHVTWGESGVVQVYPGQAYLTPGPPLNLSFRATGADAGPAIHGASAGWVWADRGDGARPVQLGASGWTQPWSFVEGKLALAGDFAIHLEEAHILAGAVSEDVLPSERTEEKFANVVQAVETQRHGLLVLQDARLELDDEAVTVFCQSSALQLRGSLTAYRSTGRLTMGSETLTFTDRELTLQGTMALGAAPVPSDAAQNATTAVDGTATGDFTAVELDFRPSSIAPMDASPMALVATAAGSLALLALAFFFTRLDENSLFLVRTRRELYQAILAHPGTTLAELLEARPTSPNNARHHLDHLERHGLISSLNVRGRLRFYPAGADTPASRQAAIVDSDPKLRALLDSIDPAGTPASVTVEVLRRRWGLSRSGSWKVIQRALQEHILVRTVEHRRVILRRAS